MYKSVLSATSACTYSTLYVHLPLLFHVIKFLLAQNENDRHIKDLGSSHQHKVHRKPQYLISL